MSENPMADALHVQLLHSKEVQDSEVPTEQEKPLPEERLPEPPPPQPVIPPAIQVQMFGDLLPGPEGPEDALDETSPEETDNPPLSQETDRAAPEKPPDEPGNGAPKSGHTATGEEQETPPSEADSSRKGKTALDRQPGSEKENAPVPRLRDDADTQYRTFSPRSRDKEQVKEVFGQKDADRTAEKGKDLLKRRFQTSAAANVGGSEEGSQGPAGAGGRSFQEAKEESRRTIDRLIHSLALPLAILFLCFLGAWILMLCVTLPETANLVNGSAIREVIREVNKDYNNRLEEIKQTPHDEIRTEGTPPDWRSVLAVYTARTSQDIESADDIEMSEAQKELLKTIFWDMNGLSAHTEPDGAKVQTYNIAPTMVPWDPSDPTQPTHPGTPTAPTEPEQPVTLVITMTGKTAAEAAELYQLTAEQRSHMEEMLRPENAALLNEVLWDIPYISGAVVDGWAYPLPEEGTITEYYGMRVHPITGAWVLHQGLDIGVAEGTPIFAVRAGTVTAATYNDSAGNYVTIDHADGFRSIYMHMAAYIVSAGQEVAAGQVIGYVGSTGESTGPHLHIGISYNGVYLDPQGYLTYQDPQETTAPGS